MIGLDTNVLVRYITQDDPAQAAMATQVMESLTEERPGFVSVVVVAELHWVLRRAYEVTAAQAAAITRTLLDSTELVVQEADAVRRAVARHTFDADFADALIVELGARAGCDHTVTFDQRAGRLPGGQLLTGAESR